MQTHRGFPHIVRAARGIVAVLVLFVSYATPLFGQIKVEANARKFLLATTYLKEGRFDRAIVLLEDLNADDPGTNAYFLRLKEAYTELKDYSGAIALIENRMLRGQSPYLLAEKGALLYRLEDEVAASDVWEQAIALAPQRSLSYREVYRSMVSVRLFDEAVEVLLRAREALNHPAAFRAELADLYASTATYDLAMVEYLAILVDSPDQQSYVRSRLSRLTLNDDLFVDALPVIEQAVRNDPLNRPIRELAAWLYREAGQYGKALDTARAIDRLESEEGRVLYAFALNAADAGAMDHAFEALDDILRLHPASLSAISAELARAGLFQHIAEGIAENAFDVHGNRIRAPNYDAAADGFRAFLQSYPNDPRVPDVLWRMARLQLDVFHELGSAEAILEEIISLHGFSPVANQARFDIGVTFLLRGDLHQARLAFSRLENDLRIGELAEKSRFELARLSFYQGQFESALTIVDALEENTASDIANDAIQLKILLRENRGPDSLDVPLHAYAEAQLFYRQRRYAEAYARLAPIVLSYQGHALDDELRYAQASSLRELGRFDESIASFNRIVIDLPDSYLADRSLFAVAEIYERKVADPAMALEAYTNLLITFPGSLLAPEVRTRIRRIRGDHV